jgi:tetratricopeptide (TPR) repeat protein
MAYAAGGQLDDAISEYKQAVAARPRYFEAHQLLAKCLIEERKFTDTFPELQATLRINPDLTEAHYLMGRVFLSMHQASAAKIELQQVKQLDSRRVLATQATQLSNAGLDAMRRHDAAGALQDLRQAVRDKPDYAIAHYNLGLILADAGNLSNGIEEVQKAISLAPLESRMRATLERMLARAGNQTTSPYAPLPETPRQHVTTGRKFAAQGDTLGAIGEYLRALQLDPSNVEARCALAAAYRQAGDAQNAMLETAKLKLLQSGTSKQ